MAADTSQKVADFFAGYAAHTFTKGEIIIQAESDPAGVFYLTEGRINQYEISPSGNSVVVNIFKPFAFFPMSWAINRTPNHYFFEAATKVVVRQAPPNDVVHFLQTNPDVLFDLLARVYRGTDGMLRRMAHLMGGNAKSRIIFELLNAAHRFGKTGQGSEIIVPLNEGDLAKQAGMSRETVSRSLQGLKADGLLKITAQGFTIKNLAELEATLGSDL